MTVFTSSKGTQEKWLKDDYFYKRDFFGGEAEAEFLVSEFLKSCGIKDYIPYEKVGSDLCRSQNFIPEGGSFVTMFRLLQQRGYTESDIEQIAKKQPQEQYNFLKKELAEIGFSEAELDSIFARLFEIDRLTLNVDRHWNNFGIIFSKDEPECLRGGTRPGRHTVPSTAQGYSSGDISGCRPSLRASRRRIGRRPSPWPRWR